jgi:hypothetical protein
MIPCRLFKTLWVSGRTFCMQCDIDLPAVPLPGSLIYVGPTASEYDEDMVSEDEGSVFLRANEPRVYVRVRPVICDLADEEQEGPNSAEEWLKHFEAYGWHECPEPKPWSVRFLGASRSSLVQ